MIPPLLGVTGEMDQHRRPFIVELRIFPISNEVDPVVGGILQQHTQIKLDMSHHIARLDVQNPRSVRAQDETLV